MDMVLAPQRLSAEGRGPITRQNAAVAPEHKRLALSKPRNPSAN